MAYRMLFNETRRRRKRMKRYWNKYYCLSQAAFLSRQYCPAVITMVCRLELLSSAQHFDLNKWLNLPKSCTKDRIDVLIYISLFSPLWTPCYTERFSSVPTMFRLERLYYELFRRRFLSMFTLTRSLYTVGIEKMRSHSEPRGDHKGREGAGGKISKIRSAGPEGVQ